ncbi:dynein associated protein-domain-containing protein [Lipomyces oligophaga]|uniref:dynein associated protein-domain-containing protein n=1 Tax=Lipomyces oligophaga TaxID=45792 RepID=UPI0034CE6D09
MTDSSGVSGHSSEIADLKSKLRILERKRQDDLARLQDLEKLRYDRAKLELVIERLESKIKPMFDSQQDLRNRLRELDTEKSKVEEQLKQRDSVVELITLDREVAEQNSENLAAEIDVLKNRLEESEIELAILKEENGLLRQSESLSEPSLTDPQLSRSAVTEENNMLREALMRLRDQTAAEEIELKNEIRKLQRDSDALIQLREKYDDLEQRLKRAEDANQSLSEQLDLAFGAEKLLDEITLRNLRLSEEVDDLRAKMEDMSTLKEINDELESNHLETEKQLQEEIDYRDMLIREQSERITQIEESSLDDEYTMARFRELVEELQADVERLRVEKSLEETEATEMERRNREMYDLNRKLQDQAQRNQTKAIDLELRKLEAQEALENFEIIKIYMPKSLAMVRESVKVYLRFRRISFKANLVLSLVSQDDSMTIAERFEISEHCQYISRASSLFATAMSICSVTEFESYGSAMNTEISPVEICLDSYLSAARNRDFKVHDILVSFEQAELIYREVSTSILDSSESKVLESGEVKTEKFKASISFLRGHTESIGLILDSIVKSMSSEKDAEITSQSQFQPLVLKGAEQIISICKTIKMLTGRIDKNIDKISNEAPLDLISDEAGQSEKILSEISLYFRRISYSLAGATERAREEIGENAVVSWSQLRFIMEREMDEDSTIFETTDPNLLFDSVCLALKRATDRIRDIATKIENGRGTEKYIERKKSWQVKLEEERKAQLRNTEIQSRLIELESEAKETAARLKQQQIELEEAVLRTALAESRASKSKARLVLLDEVERRMADQEKKMNEQRYAAERLREEVEKWQEEAARNGAEAARNAAAADELTRLEGRAIAVSAEEVQVLRSQVDALQATVRYLSSSEGEKVTGAQNDKSSVQNTVAFLRTAPLAHFSSEISRPMTGQDQRVTKSTLDSCVRGLVSLTLQSQLFQVSSTISGRHGTRTSAANKAQYESILNRLNEQIVETQKEQHWFN